MSLVLVLLLNSHITKNLNLVLVLEFKSSTSINNFDNKGRLSSTIIDNSVRKLYCIIYQ